MEGIEQLSQTNTSPVNKALHYKLKETIIMPEAPILLLQA